MESVRESGAAVRLSAVLLAFVAAVLTCTTTARAGHVYTVLLPPGWDEAIPADVNEGGVVVGHGRDPGDPTSAAKGFLFEDGTYVDVRPFGWTVAYALGINDNDLVVGHGWDGTGERAFLYDHSDGSYASFLPPGWSDAFAFDVNNDGLVAGWGIDGSVEKSFVLNSHTGSHVEIAPQSGVAQPRAILISDAGVVMGYDGGGPGWFMYKDGTFTHVSPPPGWSSAWPSDVNGAGIVVGQGNLAASSAGFIYKDGAYTPLLPAGWTHAAAGGINDNGVIVGDGLDASGFSKTFLHAGGAYTWVPLPQGWPWTYAYGLTGDKWFIGYGEDGAGALRGYLALYAPGAGDPLDYFDSAATAGTLSGDGPTSTAAEGKLQALRKMLESAKALIQGGFSSEACQQLEDAHQKTDGSPVPPDFVSGAGAVELAARIEELMSELGCS